MVGKVEEAAYFHPPLYVGSVASYSPIPPVPAGCATIADKALRGLFTLDTDPRDTSRNVIANLVDKCVLLQKPLGYCIKFVRHQ
jgi:hypothetical protein